jgi:hypothetical protein
MAGVVVSTNNGPIPPWPDDVESLRKLVREKFVLVQSSRKQFALGERRTHSIGSILKHFICFHCGAIIEVECGYSPYMIYGGPCPRCHFPQDPIDKLMSLQMETLSV